MRAVTHLSSPAAMATQHPPLPPPQHPTWRSPVPYLFGGLAAMLGLIAFALLLLACSYWKLPGYLEDGGNGEDGGADVDGKPEEAGAAKPPPSPLEQKVVVIMAGDERPTFLATPASSRASSFADSASRGTRGGEEVSKVDYEIRTERGGGGDQDGDCEAGEGSGRGQRQGSQEGQQGSPHNHEWRENPEGRRHLQGLDREQ